MNLFEVPNRIAEELRFEATDRFESEASTNEGAASSEVEQTSNSPSKVRIDMIDPFLESHEVAELLPACSRKG